MRNIEKKLIREKYYVAVLPRNRLDPTLFGKAKVTSFMTWLNSIFSIIKLNTVSLFTFLRSKRRS